MLKKIFLSFIRLYQLAISPYLGARCRFTPTCSSYCSECISKFPISKALWYSSLRLFKCHPFHSGGYDPVPDENIQK
ncbi:membrane protein insertion efficiency factor YidD [Bacteriovoracaceae bacterium]|nr:membrane protein insertion efficiency factor YidD [Bacteriovoracaceae bacterium]